MISREIIRRIENGEFRASESCQRSPQRHVTALHAAKAGHPGGSLSAADLFTICILKK